MSDDATPTFTARREDADFQFAKQKVDNWVAANRDHVPPADQGSKDQILSATFHPTAPPVTTITTAGGTGEGFDRMAAPLVDVAKGVSEIPRAAFTGAQEAVQQTINLSDMLTGTHFELPKLIDSPKSVTGGLFKGVAQFVTGFAGAGVGLRGLGLAQKLATLGRAGAIAQPVLQGAIADFAVFDPHQERLSNLVQKFPQLQNPVTDFLAAKKDDGEIEGRIKSVLEGGIGGALTQGFIKSLRAMRGMIESRASLQATLEHAAQQAKSAPPDLSVLGDPDLSDLIVEPGPAGAKPPPEPPPGARWEPGAGPEASATSKEKLAQAQGEVAAAWDQKGSGAPQVGGKADQVYINFARIDTPEDLHKLMQSMADRMKPSIDEAARGTQTFKQIRLSANRKSAWKILVERRQGEALNAEQAVAVRQLWATSADKLAEVAGLAAANPSDANLFAFRKQLAVHQAIQKEVVAARTETARSLASWKIPARRMAKRVRELGRMADSMGDGGFQSRGIEEALDASGGRDVAQDLARRVSALAQAGLDQELSEFVEKGAIAKTRDAVLQAWINGLLSNPTTHVVNTLSNMTVSYQQMFERATAARLAQLLGVENSVQLGEATAMAVGQLQGFKDMIRSLWKTRELMPPEVAEALSMRQKSEAQGGAIAAAGEAWIRKFDGMAGTQIASNSWVGRALALADSASSIPSWALGKADDVYKTLGYRMELNANAVRQAASEGRANGWAPEQVKARVAEILQNPPEDIKLSSVDGALYDTFQKTAAEVPRKVGNGILAIPVLGRMLLPFMNTPINVMTYFAERSPMAPLVAEWRADLMAGGARTDIALSRMALGNFTMLAAMDMAMSGLITGSGPSEPGARQEWMRAGNQPYSVRVGDKTYVYGRLDPLGMTLGMGADIAEIISNASEKEDAQVEKTMTAAFLAIAKNVTSKTYLTGLSQFFDAVSDPDRHGESYFQKMAGSMIPASVAVIAKQVDPYMRSAQTMVEEMKRRTPGLSQDLPLRRDLWGRPMSYRSPHGALYDVFSPFYARKVDPEPIDKELERLEYFPAAPPKNLQIKGIAVDMQRFPQAYSRYVELAGNEAKDPAWRLGAKDFLNAVIEGKHPLSAVYRLYSDGPDGGKALFIANTVQSYRELAKKQVLKEFPAIQAEYELNRREPGWKFDPKVLGGAR